MSQVSAARGCYSPLKKRPELPPSVFFKNSKSKIQLKHKEIVLLNYANLDGRSRLKPQVREPQFKVSQRLSLPTPFWRNYNSHADLMPPVPLTTHSGRYRNRSHFMQRTQTPDQLSGYSTPTNAFSSTMTKKQLGTVLSSLGLASFST